MSENYITIADKLVELGFDTDSIDRDQLTTDLRSHGIVASGYQPSMDGSVYHLLYDNSEALDGALERCGVSLPKKEVEAAVEGKKGRGRKIEKGEEAIADVSE